MRVDNFAQVVNYDGTTVAKLADFAELYSVKWRPMPDAFEDTPPSPRVVQSARKPGDASLADQEPKRQAYRPPGGSGALAEQMRREREIENQKKAVKVKMDREPVVPGAADAGPSASALRNARKKAAAQRKQHGTESPKEPEIPVPAVAAEAGTTDPAKRIRNLHKKLKEIIALKESGTKLSGPQQAKVDSEAAVLAEIQELEKSIPSSN
jgi:uncharacterized protein with WD repeat